MNQIYKGDMAIISEVEESFQNFLNKMAENYGFSEQKKSDWVSYMLKTSDREQLLEHVLSYFNLVDHKDYRVLDIGCGFGGLIIALQQHFENVYGIEIIKERAKWAQKRAPNSKIICGSAINLPWPDQHFDLVFSTDVFEHISFTEQKIAAYELMRILKPNGYGFITVPNRFQLTDEQNYVYLVLGCQSTSVRDM